MNRLRAIILLLIYGAFSCISVASGHLYVENASEGTEKEVFSTSVPEHRESSSVRLSGKFDPATRPVTYASPYFSPAHVNNKVVSLVFNSPKAAVPKYIMHCVYRL